MASVGCEVDCFADLDRCSWASNALLANLEKASLAVALSHVGFIYSYSMTVSYYIDSDSNRRSNRFPKSFHCSLTL